MLCYEAAFLGLPFVSFGGGFVSKRDELPYKLDVVEVGGSWIWLSDL